MLHSNVSSKRNAMVGCALRAVLQQMQLLLRPHARQRQPTEARIRARGRSLHRLQPRRPRVRRLGLALRSLLDKQRTICLSTLQIGPKAKLLNRAWQLSAPKTGDDMAEASEQGMLAAHASEKQHSARIVEQIKLVVQMTQIDYTALRSWAERGRACGCARACEARCASLPPCTSSAARPSEKPRLPATQQAREHQAQEFLTFHNNSDGRCQWRKTLTRRKDLNLRVFFSLFFLPLALFVTTAGVIALWHRAAIPPCTGPPAAAAENSCFCVGPAAAAIVEGTCFSGAAAPL